MPRRRIFTERQRSALFDLPTDERAILHHYTLADDDIEHIRTRRHSRNRLGFALQLCAFRYPGRLLATGETIPLEISRFIAAQLGEDPDHLSHYAETAVTRRRHLIELRSIYGYKMFSGGGARDLKAWLETEAEGARSNEDLARRFVEQCRTSHTILPGVTVIERLCADALVAAERRIEARIVEHLDSDTRDKLDALLTEEVEGSVTRFIWLRQFEVGQNSADMNRLLDRLEFLQGLKLDTAILGEVPPHRATRLRRQGERYFAGDLRDISGDRRLAILAVCALGWRSAIAPSRQIALQSPAGQWIPLLKRTTGSLARHGVRQSPAATPAWPMLNPRYVKRFALSEIWALAFWKRKGITRPSMSQPKPLVAGINWKALWRPPHN